ncbi:hypothetical protein PV04_06614 [Phialophora macrospora]|uniref:Asteroid domain-containing protein n=1 Tax=Phialophora macrospora TaxID=1851006 RepID=A0A0D2FH07_9EURO|nr:hypothetical protein PV04_06614 [Phialophora macrospora]
MGIQRLLHDLLPYAEPVVLSASPQTATDTTNVETLIIDGPSLVYYVYNKLVAWYCVNSPTFLVLPPTYDEINQGVLRVLDDLQTHGVCITHIFFDGGLPTSKREVRLDRMEKVRQQLEVCRALQTDFPPYAAPSAEVQDFEKALWENPGISTRRSTPPAPPFMVASVIETLRMADSRWMKHVHVVPGEADLYCALAAQASAEAVAILTNDTDLAVHELGERGCVALLHSLEKKPQSPGVKDSRFTVLSLDPAHIASRMNIESLCGFGFERFLDSSVSTAIIRERARDPSRLHKLKSEYTTFLEEFLPSLPVSANTQPGLDGIDPRTAELIVGFGDSPHVYLTPILEDPQRDSSWSYGAGIRQLAYTLLSSSVMSKGDRRKQPAAHVTEYARKGQRIASATVLALKPSDAISQIAELEALLATYIPPADSSPVVSEETALSTWYRLAIHLVHQGKVRLNKSPTTTAQVARLFGLRVKTPPRMSWEDIHLLANIQAVLYSFRMLYQITGYLENQTPHYSASAAMASPHSGDNEELSKAIARLHNALSSMPSIADLFLDIPHLCRELSDADMETRNWIIRCLNVVLEPESQPVFAVETPVTGQGNQDTTNEAVWIPAKPKKKRKRGLPSETKAVSAKTTNIFRLLSEDPG